MSIFVEGLQGSGKSTAVNILSRKHPGMRVYREGDHSPVELAWCAYVTEDTYRGILDKYTDLRRETEENSFRENDRTVICYTKIKNGSAEFYKDMERYEIYNGRLPLDEFKNILLHRYSAWDGSGGIFECSLFQNTVEELTLFRCLADDDIIEMYKNIAEVLKNKDVHILYIRTDDITANLDAVRKERSDENGNEIWFDMLCGYFDNSPYAMKHGVSGVKGLTEHLMHRQELELRICREVFADKYNIIVSKMYNESDI